MSILKKPLITEKVSSLNERGVYGFIVDSKTSKSEIKKAVEEAYRTNVHSVNTIRYAGKKRTRYTKAGMRRGQQPAYKKALVTLQEGGLIDFYSN